jgi:hypothetical protein
MILAAAERTARSRTTKARVSTLGAKCTFQANSFLRRATVQEREEVSTDDDQHPPQRGGGGDRQGAGVLSPSAIMFDSRASQGGATTTSSSNPAPPTAVPQPMMEAVPRVRLRSDQSHRRRLSLLHASNERRRSELGSRPYLEKRRRMKGCNPLPLRPGSPQGVQALD